MKSILDCAIVDFMGMRILVVAPESEIGAPLPLIKSEVFAIMNSAIPAHVLGDADVAYNDIARELERAVLDRNPFNVWWFAGHGSYDPAQAVWKNGVALSRTILTVQQLAILARIHQPDLIYLNTCASVFLGNLIMEECGADVIATLGEIADQPAVEMAISFATRLATVQDFRRAYEDVRPPSNTNFLYITSCRKRANVDAQLLEGYVTKDELREVHDDIDKRIRRIEAEQIMRMPGDSPVARNWFVAVQFLVAAQLTIVILGVIVWFISRGF